MRSHFVLILCAALVLSAVALVDPSLGQAGLELLPDDTGGVLTIESLSRLYATIELDTLRTEYPAAFLRLTEEMVQDVGIDLLDPGAMHEEGFDIGRPLHVAVLAEPAAVVVLIPGEPRALAWVRAKLEEQGARFTAETEHRGTRIEGSSADELACFARDGYVSIVVTNKEDGGGPAVETAKRLVERSWKRSISEAPLFRKIMERLPSDSDVRVYIGPGMQERMSNWGQSKQQLAERGMTSDDVNRTYKAMGIEDMAQGMTLRISSDRLAVDTYTWVGEDSPLLAWFRINGDPVPFLRRLPAQPWLISIGRLNLGEVWKTMSSVMHAAYDSIPSPDEMLKPVNEELGIDVETEVIGQVNGNVGFLIDRVSLMGQEVMLIAQVADPPRFGSTLARVTKRVQERMAAKSEEKPGHPAASIVEDQSAGTTFYRIVSPMAEVCYGIVGDHFIVTTSAARFRGVVDGAGGFAEGLGNAEVAAALGSPAAGVFYVDFRGLARDAQGLLPMLGPGGQKYGRWLDELSELVAVSRVDREGASQGGALTSTTPGIWKRLIAPALEAMEAR